MRENMGLYRGKRKDNGEWVEGGIVVNGDYVAIVQFSDYHGWHDFIEVIPDTAGQCAGLTDKNGKRIFEGDIVKTNQYGKDDAHGHNFAGFDVFYVRFAEGRFSLYNNWRRFNLCNGSDMEVIGNIHDNPELLEVSSDE